MKIKLLVVGKTDDKQIALLFDIYQKRLQYYIKFEFEVIPDVKNTKHLSEKQQKEQEGIEILKRVQPTDHLMLLDEKGKQYSSVEFSKLLQKKMNAACKQLVLVVGGPYGFSDEVYERAQGKISLSKMTFSHQMVRVFIAEQLYRAFTILRNEPYHHE